MSEDGLNPMETILRLCAAASPDPWYPRLFAKQEGVDPKALSRCLEDLWLSGLIDRADGGEEKGPAIYLTRGGQRVLLDPEALQRLRAGKPISTNDRAAVIRNALRGSTRPLITRLLLALNIFIFLFGYYTARKVGAGSAFLAGGPPAQLIEVLDQSGALAPEYLIDGQWQRLLTAGFVHIGFLHLLMNMSCLFIAGRFIEQMWGHLRYLVIYLVSILGGCVLGIAHDATRLAGASGAVCGLLAAEAVWFLFNRRYLPRALLRQARTIFIVNVVLLIFISSFRNVSAWGHIGGAAAGALAAMLLQLHRFGPPVWRWLAITGFVPLAWYGQYSIEHARATDPTWQDIERDVLVKRFAIPITEASTEAKKVYQESALPLLEKHPSRREEAKIQLVQSELAEQREKLQALEEELTRFGSLFSPNGERKKQWYRDRIARRFEWIDSAAEALRDGSKWSQTECEQRDFETHFLRVTDSILSEAMDVYRERIRPVFEKEASQRGAAAIKNAQAALADQFPRVLDLVEELRVAGPYEDETVEKARLTALRYANTSGELFKFCKEELNTGAKETESLKQDLDEREKKVENYHKKWRDLVE
jgi:rhomboid protease GluP